MIQATHEKTKKVLAVQADMIHDYLDSKAITHDLLTLEFDGTHAVMQFAIATAQATAEIVEDLFLKWPHVIKVHSQVGNPRVFTIVFDMDGLQHA